MAESPFAPLGPLDDGHDRTVFDCGVPALNLYLRNYSLQNQKRGIVRNYVTTHKDTKIVVAYYSLVYASLDRTLLPTKLTKGLGKYDIPIMLLARLAVDHREQGKGLGTRSPQGRAPSNHAGSRDCRSEMSSRPCERRICRRVLSKARFRAGYKRSV